MGYRRKGISRSLGKMARDAIESGSPQNNPKVPTEKEIISLYQHAYALTTY